MIKNLCKIFPVICLLGVVTFSIQVPAIEPPKKVLFICTGNYYRSRLAEAVFNYNFGEGKSNWTAFSRGLNPGYLTPKQRQFPVSIYSLKKLDDLKIPHKYIEGKPTQLTQADLDQSDVIVAVHRKEHEPMLTKQFPDYDLKKVEFWEVPDGGKSEKEFNQALQIVYEKTLELGHRLIRKPL